MTTMYFTISTTTDIPIQIAKWLAICETATSPRCKHGHCTLTDIQVVSEKNIRVLCIVEDCDLEIVLGIDRWAKVYTEEEANEAWASIPLPSWVQMEHPTKGPRVSNLTCAKYLAEILLALFLLYQGLNDTDGALDLHHSTLRLALLAFGEMIEHGLDGCKQAYPLSDERLESILNLADYWCVRLTSPSGTLLMPPMPPLPPMPPPPIKGSKEYRIMKRNERAEADRRYWETEGFAEAERTRERVCADSELPKLPEQWKKGDFPKLGRLPHGSSVSVTGRSTYADNAPKIVPGATPGQVALCIPSPPKIITEDLKKLCKVAYLGLPEYNEKTWFHGKSQFDLRTNMTALAA